MSNRHRFAVPTGRQRGAVLIYFAAFFGVALAAFAMCIDIGRLYNAQRDLQRLANVAALDAAQLSGGCYGNQGGALSSNPLSLAQAEATASLTRNKNSTDVVPGATVQLGKMVTTNGVRTFVPLASGEDVNARTAVQVTLTRATPARLLPLSPGKSMVARASAESRPVVTIGGRSGTVSVDLLNAALKNLGFAAGLSLVDYSGLLGATITLGELATGLNAGSVDDILKANASFPLSKVLNALGQGKTGQIPILLKSIASAVSPSATVDLSKVITGNVNGASGTEGAAVNVGQLLEGLAQLANGKNLLTLPPLQLPLTLVGINSTVQARIIEPRTTAIIRAGVLPTAGNTTSYNGNTYASTAQLVVEIHIKSTAAINGLINLDLPLYLQLAKATASLDEVRCATRSRTQHQVDLKAQASIAGLGLGRFDDLNAPSPKPVTSVVPIVSLVSLGPGGGLISLNAAPVTVPVQSTSKILSFSGPPFATPYQKITTSVPAGLSSAVSGLTAAQLQVCLGPCSSPLSGLLKLTVDLLVSPLLGLVNSTLQPIFAALDPAVSGLLSGLGVDAGNAEFQVISLSPVNNHAAAADADGKLSLQAFIFGH